MFKCINVVPISLSLLLFFTNGLMAQDSSNNNVETENHEMPLMALREDEKGEKISARGAKFTARSASRGAIVILYLGDDVDQANKIIEGATLAKKLGAKVRGVALANSDEAFATKHSGYTESFEILVDGISATTKQLDPRDFNPSNLSKLIMEIQNKYTPDLRRG